MNDFPRPRLITQPQCPFCGSADVALPPPPDDSFQICDGCLLLPEKVLINTRLMQEQREAEQWLRILGLPRYVPWRILVFDGDSILGEVAAGFTVELVGIATRWLTAIAPELDEDEPVGRLLEIELERGTGPERIAPFMGKLQVPAVRVPGHSSPFVLVHQAIVKGLDGSPVVVHRWQDGNGMQETRGPHLSPGSEDITIARQLLSPSWIIGYQRARAGRPAGSSPYNVFNYLEALCAFNRQTGELPRSKSQFLEWSEQLGESRITESTLKRWLKRQGWNWTQFRETASLYCSQSPN
jgi:hypothetical protein